MKLIVGLGNPGRIYINSRHNIGFAAVKALAKVYKISFRNESGSFSLSGKGKIAGQSIIIALPLTFMNLSGIAVRALLKKHKIDLDNLLVVCDNLDLGLGRLKLKASGSSGGHRGLESIIDALGSQNFCRLRIGIGRPATNMDCAQYVLSAFSKKERVEVSEAVKKAKDCCRAWVTKGITESMDIFNQPLSVPALKSGVYPRVILSTSTSS